MGVKNNIEKYTVSFYTKYYDVVRTPDFKDSTRLLKPEHGLNYLGKKSNRVCRFCGKTEAETSFVKIAHAFPESIGNKVLATYYECDACNDFFGKTIESEYGIFFALYHSIMKTVGKDGKKKCNFKIPCKKRKNNCADYCVRIEYNDNQLVVSQCEEASSQYVDLKDNSIKISRPLGKCCPIAVFKALTKMALTVMPDEELGLFADTIAWLKKEVHENFYGQRRLLIRYQFIPGFNVVEYPHFILYRRKRDVWDKPYMLFNLTYGCFSLMIEVPKNKTDSDFGFCSIPFVPIIYHSSESGVWDMSDVSTPKGKSQSVEIFYQEMMSAEDNVEVIDGKLVFNNIVK